MAIDVTCECGREFGVTNDSVGRNVKCPECGARIQVVEASISVEPEPSTNVVQQPSVASDASSTSTTESRVSELSRKDASSKQVSAESRKSKAALKQERVANRQSRKAETKEARAALKHSDVPLGVSWVYYGFLLVILVSVLEIVVSLASRRTVSQGELSAAGVLNVLALAASFLTIVGKFLCLSAPSEMYGKGWIRQVLLVDMLAVFVCVIGKSVVLSPELVMVLMAAMILLPVWGFGSFVLFLRSLGEFLDQRNITDKAAGVLTFVRILLIAVLILLLLTLVNAQPLVALGLVVLLIYGIVGSLRYLALLSACRDALTKAKD